MILKLNNNVIKMITKIFIIIFFGVIKANLIYRGES